MHILVHLGVLKEIHFDSAYYMSKHRYIYTRNAPND